MIPRLYSGDGALSRRIVSVWDRLEATVPWYVATARISEIVVSADPTVRAQIAQYRHGTRDLRVAPGVGAELERAVAHELAHGFDDAAELPGANPHRFSMSDEFVFAWRSQTHFEIQKYGKDPREHFADVASKAVLLGLTKLSYWAPNEASYLGRVVFPTLQAEYAAMVSR